MHSIVTAFFFLTPRIPNDRDFPGHVTGHLPPDVCPCLGFGQLLRADIREGNCPDGRCSTLVWSYYVTVFTRVLPATRQDVASSQGHRPWLFAVSRTSDHSNTFRAFCRPLVSLCCHRGSDELKIVRCPPRTRAASHARGLYRPIENVLDVDGMQWAICTDSSITSCTEGHKQLSNVYRVGQKVRPQNHGHISVKS